MHQLLSALVTILLSFCHHTAASRPLEASNAYIVDQPTPSLTFPDRHELAHVSSDAGYAGAACLSCGTTSVSFTVR